VEAKDGMDATRRSQTAGLDWLHPAQARAAATTLKRRRRREREVGERAGRERERERERERVWLAWGKAAGLYCSAWATWMTCMRAGLHGLSTRRCVATQGLLPATALPWARRTIDKRTETPRLGLGSTTKFPQLPYTGTHVLQRVAGRAGAHASSGARRRRRRVPVLFHLRRFENAKLPKVATKLKISKK
jgi:hypothetical protein